MFTDNEVVLAMGYDRSIRATVSDAQALVDRKNRQIGALQRQLASTQRELAAARAEIEQLRQERGQASMAEFQRVRAIRNARSH